MIRSIREGYTFETVQPSKSVLLIRRTALYSLCSFVTIATHTAYTEDPLISVSYVAKHKPSPLPHRPDGMHSRHQKMFQCSVKSPTGPL